MNAKSIFTYILVSVGIIISVKVNSRVNTLKDEIASLESRLESNKLKEIEFPVNRDSLDFYTDFPNDTSVYKALLFFDIPNPKIVLAQAKLETGHYRRVPSGNLFGLRGRNGYMRFNHWTESIICYKKCISSRYSGERSNNEEYLTFLSRIGYAESKSYNKVLRSIVRDIEKMEFIN